MQEVKKKKFEVRINHENGIKRIFIDEELFDWNLNQDDLRRARNMGLEYYKAAIIDVQRHFLDSLSEFMGRQITQEEFANATMSGWI